MQNRKEIKMQTTNTILELSELINSNDNKRALILLDKLIEFKSQAPTKDSVQSWYTLLKRFKTFYLGHINGNIKSLEDIPFNSFKHGNGKHPFINYSTIPVTNCQGAGECVKYCYSKNSMRFPLAVTSWLQNQILENHYFHLLEISFKNFINQSKYKKALKKNGHINFRLYNDGDFRTKDILVKWMELLRGLPGVKCYGYTKSLHFLKSLSIEGYKFPNNYKTNISLGGKYDGLKDSNLIKRLNIYRGEFISHKLEKTFKTAQGYKKEDYKTIRQSYKNDKIFICPLVCGSCTSVGHACGSDVFQDKKIIIPIHG